MTIETGISIIRSLINQYSDDSSYTDELLYELVAKARSEIMDKEYNKFEYKSDWDYQHICVPMCVATNHDCDCVPVGCKVLKSKFQLPRPLTARNKNEFYVYTLGGTPLIPMNKRDYDLAQLSDILKDVIGYEIRDKWLILWGADTQRVIPKTLDIKMIPEDVVQLAQVPKCNANGTYTGETCLDPLILDMNMKGAYEMLAYQRVLDYLGVKAKFPDNPSNDSNQT